MKHTLRLALFFASFSLFSGARAQVSQPDEMVRKIFSTLQTKDEKAFVALYPNATQFTSMMRTMMKQVLNTPEVQQAMAADPTAKGMNIDSLINGEVDKMSKPEAFVQMQKKFATSFQKAIEKGEKKGVEWSDAKLTNFTMDTTAELDADMAPLKATGIKTMKGLMDFSSGGTDYQMNFTKVMYLPAENGWFGGEFSEVIKKGESFSATGTTQVMDAAGDDTKPIGTTGKTKSKTSAGKATTKTKSTSVKTKAKTKA